MTLYRPMAKFFLEGMSPGSVDQDTRIPWEGTSPRALTSGYSRFTFKTPAEKSASEDPLQLDMFDHGPSTQGGPAMFVYGGVPLLRVLPGLKSRRHHGKAR